MHLHPHEPMLDEIRSDLRYKFNSENPDVADITAYLIGVQIYATVRATHTPADQRTLAQDVDAQLARIYLPFYEELMADAGAAQLRSVMRGIIHSIRAYAQRAPLMPATSDENGPSA